MSTAQTDNKILRRVRKMMKLAEDAGATEHERDTAMKMVHATLAKYNIEMSQVSASEEQEKRGQLNKPFLGKPWAIQIASAVARMYFCHYHYHTLGGNAGPTQKAMHVFVGLHSNVTTAQEMAQFVVESVNKEAQRYQRANGLGYADYRAFAQGAAARIRQRAAEIEHAAKTKGVEAVQTPVDDEPTSPAAPAIPGTALVIASLYQKEDDANKAYLEQLKITLKPGRGQTVDMSRDRSRRAGVEYGSKVSLHTQITSKSNKQLK